MLSLTDVHAYRELYWQDREPDPQMTPLAATHFGGLPPTLAIGVEHDPLRVTHAFTSNESRPREERAICGWAQDSYMDACAHSVLASDL